MDFQIKSNIEIHEGAVLVVSGQHKGRVGFYCLQNEQTYDMGKIANCSDCQLTQEAKTNVFDSFLEIEIGSYCESHRKTLIENDMAIIYWDKPFGCNYSLIHPSELEPVPSTEYARYEKKCQMDVKEALFRLMEALGKI